MTAIYQSPFLIALGWTIAASIWQSALLWLIYQLIHNINRKISPSVKHVFAAAFLLGSFVWFCFTLADKYSEVVTINQYLSALPGKESLTMAVQDISRVSLFENNLVAFINQYLPYISAAYLIVLLLLSVKLLKAYLHVGHMKAKGLLPIDAYWINLVEKYAQKIGIGKKVNIFLSNYISVPATLNYFKPVILLPLAAFNHLTPQQVESVILHELAHIKRNDYLINIIASVIETILFFNPFVHLLGKSLQKEREHCCDDFVLQRRFDPHSYASALLSLEQMRVGVHPLAIAATGGNNQLLGRVKRIMNVKTTNFNYGQILLAFAVTTFMMISVAWLAPSSHRNVIAGSGESRDEAVISLKATDSLTSAGNGIPSLSKSEGIKMAMRDVSPTSRSRTPRDIYPGTSSGVAPNFAPGLADEMQVRQTAPPLPPLPPLPPTLKRETNLSAENHGDTIYFFAPSPALDGSRWNNKNEDAFKPGDELLEYELWNLTHPTKTKDKVVSFDDVIKLMDEAQIQKNKLLQQQQQLHVLFEKQFNNAQLQFDNINEMEMERFEREIKKNNAKRRAVQKNDDFLFSHSPGENLKELNKSLMERNSSVDSLGEKSIQMAEKQRGMWRNSAEDRMQWGDEKNGHRVFEFTFNMEGFPDFVSSEIPSAVHEKVIELTGSKKNKERNEQETVAENAPLIRKYIFTTTPVEKAAPKPPDSPARSMRAVKSKTVVITL
ncbi:MAG TPA: M56 family metallopeptidase [Agriterribacter sp.]|nr:M56 family metallopeptidase [Agriterribacter sp.]